MLLEFSLSNYRSIREEITFSTLAGKDTSHADSIIEYDKYDVLKTSAIYGANGTGKSNFIKGLGFVKSLVSNSINMQPGQLVAQNPFKLDGIDKESVFNVKFTKNSVLFVFQFSLKNKAVKDEYLFYYPNGRQTKIFERHENSFVAGRSFRGKFDRCKDVIKPNRLMLSCAANFSNVHEVEAVFLFFKDDLVIYNSGNQNNWLDYSLYTMSDNTDVKNSVIKFMQNIGIGIRNINIRIDKKRLNEDEIPHIFAPELQQKLLSDPVDKINAQVVYDGFQTDLLSEESDGIRKLFAFICPFVDIIKNDKVLICDEIEMGLHESLVSSLIKGFINDESGSKAQLIFTTHDTSLLSMDIFRRDQIWFTELKKDRSTDMYSLAEIKNVRKDENFAKGYIAGKYGAIPMLNADFVSEFSE